MRQGIVRRARSSEAAVAAEVYLRDDSRNQDCVPDIQYAWHPDVSHTIPE
jgi:hypothetical protein